jgi:hypothetical protein
MEHSSFTVRWINDKERACRGCGSTLFRVQPCRQGLLHLCVADVCVGGTFKGNDMWKWIRHTRQWSGFRASRATLFRVPDHVMTKSQTHVIQ